MPRVKAKVDHFHAGHYRKEGEVFDQEGKLHEHVELVDKPKGKAKPEEDDSQGELLGDQGSAIK